MDELNRTMQQLADEVRAARAETAQNTAAVANFAGKMEVWQTSTLTSMDKRISTLEANQRADTKEVSGNTAKLAAVLGAAVLVGNLLTAVGLAVFHG